MFKKDFHEIYQKYANYVYYFCLHLTKDSGNAEELMQETFYQALKGIDNYKGLCKIEVWLCQIAKNQFYKNLKSQYRENEIIEEYEIHIKDVMEKSAEEIFFDKDSREKKIRLITEIMETLPEQVQLVVKLRIDENLSFKEIGQAMGKSENWARVTFYRAKVKIIERSRGNEDKL